MKLTDEYDLSINISNRKAATRLSTGNFIKCGFISIFALTQKGYSFFSDSTPRLALDSMISRQEPRERLSDSKLERQSGPMKQRGVQKSIDVFVLAESKVLFTTSCVSALSKRRRLSDGLFRSYTSFLEIARCIVYNYVEAVCVTSLKPSGLERQRT